MKKVRGQIVEEKTRGTRHNQVLHARMHAVNGPKLEQPKPSQPKSRQAVPTKITEAEARRALQRSGYLMEYRVEALLRRRGWYVEANSAYEDSDTQKSREIDIYAIIGRPVGTGPKDWLFSSVLVECVNNPQPIAFITKTPSIREWAVDDIKGVFDPEEVLVKGSTETINVGHLLKIASYHHYCRGRLASQFCSFNYKSDKKEWMAWHDEVHFNAFSTLVKALEYRFTQFELVAGIYINWEFINPVVVLQGDLLDVRCAGGTVSFRRAEHIKFRRTLIWKGKERSYMIDVVTERAFPSFVAMLEGELKRTATRVKRNVEVIKATLRTNQAKTRKRRLKKRP